MEGIELINKILYTRVPAKPIIHKSHNVYKQEIPKEEAFGRDRVVSLWDKKGLPLGTISFQAISAQKSSNDQDFLNYCEVLDKQLAPLAEARMIALFNHACDMTEANRISLHDAEQTLIKKMQDPQILERFYAFKEKGLTDEKLQKILERKISSFEKYASTSDDLVALDDQAHKIQQHMRQKEIEVGVSNVILKGDSEIAAELKELAKQRNAYVQKLGYNNYFEYELDRTYNMTDKAFIDFATKFITETRDVYEELQYKSTLSTHMALRNLVKDPEMVVDVSKKMYTSLGWGSEDDTFYYDLTPRKTKATGACCALIKIPDDIRISVSNRGNMDALQALNHEKGHGFYKKGISTTLPSFYQAAGSLCLDEAVAILMGKLLVMEPEFLVKELDLPEALVKPIKKSYNVEILKDLHHSLSELLLERELYRNPDQDMAAAKSQILVDYEGWRYINPGDWKDDWINQPHMITQPVYNLSYVLAEIMATQLYAALTEQVGGLLTEKGGVKEILTEKLFCHGRSLSEEELLMNLTGKPFSPEAFIEEVNKSNYLSQPF